MPFSKGVFQPDEIAELSSALDKICTELDILSDSPSRTSIATALIDAYHADEEGFDQFVEEFIRTKRAA